MKNSHRYFNLDVPSDLQRHILQNQPLNDTKNLTLCDMSKEVNKKLRVACDLKGKNRLVEHQNVVQQLKKEFKSFRNLSSVSGIALKTVHNWCSLPKQKVHKAKELSQLRRTEFEQFLLQDTISFAYPSKRYAGKRFLCDTLDMTRKKYLAQPEYHKYGIVSMSTMKMYRPRYILLCGETPLDQCLCDKCENFEQILKALIAIGMKCIPSNRYDAVDSVVCSTRHKQFGSDFEFPNMDCLAGKCENCGEHLLHEVITGGNEQLFLENKRISWRKWITQTGTSAPDKCQIKGTVRQALDELLQMLQSLKMHLFRANWNRNVFDYIRHHLSSGYIVQIFDFAMNFKNVYQDEIQSAYWDGMQTAIHVVINYFSCPNVDCHDVVTLIIAQITDDLRHDSFVARAGHDAAFRYLCKIGVPLELILQFSDNCSSQYKSHRLFAEMARCPLDLIRVYFGEKHRKSNCDGFFGCLKAWMTYKIKTRHVIIMNANDFFRCCKEEYETPPVPEGTCQHYRIVFQFLHPSDIRRYHDCDLDSGIPGTRSIYSVRNTPHPLKLKVRNIPCLCRACILDNGDKCDNYHYTDAWREVELKPVKGDNRRKHLKRKHPKDYLSNGRENSSEEQEEVVDTCDEDLPEIIFEEANDDGEPMVNLTGIPKIDSSRQQANPTELFIDLTEGAENSPDMTIEPVEVEDFIITDLQKDPENVQSLQVPSDDNLIPDNIYWESILGSLERCTNTDEVLQMAEDLHATLKPLRRRNMNVHLDPDSDYIDATATASLPADGPQNVHAIWTEGDGNCMCRSLSKGYSGNDSMHLEICARIVIDGILNKEKYTSEEYLSRGSSVIHEDEILPFLYVRFSDYYVNGQKITENTVDYTYCREMHDCAKENSYMGLWQLAQAANILNCPIQSVFPTGGDEIMRMDFHRMFFPLEQNKDTSSEPIIIMWTGVRKGFAPSHFVPLLPKRNKYKKHESLHYFVISVAGF